MSYVGGADQTGAGKNDVLVLIVDDQEVFRAVLREVLAATDGFTLIGEATSGEQALVATGELSPQLVIMDKRLPGLDGIEATRVITSCHPRITVVIVSVEEPDPDVRESSGAAAFIRKRELLPRVLRNIWREHGQRIENASSEGGWAD